MSDKPVAAFVTFLFVFPLTVICCAGPTALVAGAVTALAWLSQSKTLVVISLGIGAAVILRHIIKARRGATSSGRPGAGTITPVPLRGD